MGTYTCLRFNKHILNVFFYVVLVSFVFFLIDFLCLSLFAAKLSIHVSDGLLWRSVIAVFPRKMKRHAAVNLLFFCVRSYLTESSNRQRPGTALFGLERERKNVLNKQTLPAMLQHLRHFCYMQRAKAVWHVGHPGCGAEDKAMDRLYCMGFPIALDDEIYKNKP